MEGGRLMAPRPRGGDPDDPGSSSNGSRSRPRTPIAPPTTTIERDETRRRPGQAPADPTRYPGYDPDKGYPLAQYVDWRNRLRSEFPGLFENEPELAALMWQRESEKWSDERMQLAYDNWERAHAVDTGGGGGGRGGGGGGGGQTTEQQIEGAYAAIKNLLGTWGLEMTEESMRAVAGAAVQNKWDTNQLEDYLAGAIDGSTLQEGTVLSSEQVIREKARSQLLNVSDETVRQYARRIASSELTMEGVDALLKQQAKLAWGWAAESIDQGFSVVDVLAPTRDLLAQTLDLGPASIDLMDPKYSGMIQTRDEKTGEIRAATTEEVLARARQTDRFKQTRGAGEMVAKAAMMFRKIQEGQVSGF
jgi:hypothetical protein